MNIDDIKINIEYNQIGEDVPFAEAAKLYEKSKYIGEANDGWTKIVRVDHTYYMVECGLPEHEGHIYMTPVEITGIEIYEQ